MKFNIFKTGIMKKWDDLSFEQQEEALHKHAYLCAGPGMLGSMLLISVSVFVFVVFSAYRVYAINAGLISLSLYVYCYRKLAGRRNRYAQNN